MMNSMMTDSDEEFIDIVTVENEENAACALKRLINDDENLDSASISRNSSLDQSTLLSDRVNVLDLMTKLQNVKVVLKRLSTIEILKYTKKPDTDLDATDKKYLQNSERNHTNSTTKLLNSDLQVGQNVKFTCRFCQKDFGIIYSFKQHVSYCGKEPDNFCKFCPFETQYSSNFKSHLLKKHGITDVEASSETYKTSADNAFNGTDQISSNIKWRYCFTCNKTTAIGDISSDSMTCSKCNTELNYQCTQCKEQFENRERAIRHSKFGCPREQTRCPECPYVTSAISLFYFHMNNKHPFKPVKPVCGKCLNQFQSISSLKSHWQICTKIKFNMMFCDHCEFYTDSKKILADHLRQHLSTSYSHDFNEDNNHKCLICGKKFQQVSTLKKHLRHCGEEQVHCKLCSFKTKYRKNLVRHLNLVHSSNKSNEIQPNPTKLTERYSMHCVNCDKTVTISEGIRIDGILHCRICKAKCQWRCNRCNHMDEFYIRMYYHIKYCYNSTNKYHCTYCDYVSVRRIDLTKHIRQKHVIVDQNKLVECPKCGKSYRSYKHFVDHAARSCGNKKLNFHCEMCSYNTNYKSSLYAHMKRHHENGSRGVAHGFKKRNVLEEKMAYDKQISNTCGALSNAEVSKFLKNYSNCPTCGKAFAQVDNLKMHEKVCRANIKMQEDL